MLHYNRQYQTLGSWIVLVITVWNKRNVVRQSMYSKNVFICSSSFQKFAHAGSSEQTNFPSDRQVITGVTVCQAQITPLVFPLVEDLWYFPCMLCQIIFPESRKGLFVSLRRVLVVFGNHLCCYPNFSRSVVSWAWCQAAGTLSLLGNPNMARCQLHQ